MHAYTVLNAFSRDPMAGNPVAVFTRAEDFDTELCQALARQLQLSETTFVSDIFRPEGPRVRIFTPVNELPFAGHPLLGTAARVAQCTGRSKFGLETERCWVEARVTPRGADIAEVAIETPLARPVPLGRVDAVLAALGLGAVALPVTLYDAGARHVLVTVGSVEALHAIRPDHGAP